MFYYSERRIATPETILVSGNTIYQIEFLNALAANSEYLGCINIKFRGGHVFVVQRLKAVIFLSK